MTIFAVHTDGGAPINESALCSEHIRDGELREFAYNAAANAEDAPKEIRFDPVKHPENNDTECIECRVGGVT